MLASPMATPFPNFEELESAIALRSCIVDAARRTSVAFDTEQAERPEEYFEYHKGSGFCLRPGKSLIDALLRATQPDVSGTRYSFSCYRATEYILLLAIATGLRQRNPHMLERLESLWQRRAIMSNEFPQRLPARIRLARSATAAALFRARRPPVVSQPGRALGRRHGL